APITARDKTGRRVGGYWGHEARRRSGPGRSGVSGATGTDLCRVVLVAPHRTMEMALPARVPLADLLPALVQRATVSGHSGRSRPSRRGGLSGEGDWVLQRLGGTALDEDLTPDALHIRDG